MTAVLELVIVVDSVDVARVSIHVLSQHALLNAHTTLLGTTSNALLSSMLSLTQEA